MLSRSQSNFDNSITAPADHVPLTGTSDSEMSSENGE